MCRAACSTRGLTRKKRRDDRVAGKWMNVVVFCWESGLCWDSGSPRTVSISSARVSYFSETGVGRTRSSLILVRRKVLYLDVHLPHFSSRFPFSVREYIAIHRIFRSFVRKIQIYWQLRCFSWIYPHRRCINHFYGYRSACIIYIYMYFIKP